MADDPSTLIASAMAGTLMATAVSPNAIEIFPMSAGLTGAVIAAFRTRKQSTLSAAEITRMASAVLAGAAAAIFVSPVVCVQMLRWETIQSVTFGHFFFGLIGSTLVDLILEKRTVIGGNIIGAGLKAWLMAGGGQPPAPAPSPAPPEPKAEDKS